MPYPCLHRLVSASRLGSPFTFVVQKKSLTGPRARAGGEGGRGRATKVGDEGEGAAGGCPLHKRNSPAGNRRPSIEPIVSEVFERPWRAGAGQKHSPGRPRRAGVARLGIPAVSPRSIVPRCQSTAPLAVLPVRVVTFLPLAAPAPLVQNCHCDDAASKQQVQPPRSRRRLVGEGGAEERGHRGRTVVAVTWVGRVGKEDQRAGSAEQRGREAADDLVIEQRGGVREGLLVGSSARTSDGAGRDGGGRGPAVATTSRAGVCLPAHAPLTPPGIG